jgi:pimeloyl-ACP methyl ester carboxylesterase
VVQGFGFRERDVERVDVEGLTIAFERAGDGPPLVLLHGGFTDHRAWRWQLESLSDAWTVVAWDAPGCGGSSDPPAGFGLGDYADCVAGLVAALGLQRPHVGGLSFGAGLALNVYERYPELPCSLALAGAYAGWGGSLSPQEVEARLARAVVDADRPPEQWVEDYLPTFFAGEVPQEAVDELVAMMLDTRPAGMLPMLHAFAEADLRPVLPRIALPTLLLYGDADVRSSLAVAEELHAAIAASQLVVLPGVGHVCNVEAPDAFDAELRRFLLSVDAPEG